MGAGDAVDDPNGSKEVGVDAAAALSLSAKGDDGVTAGAGGGGVDEPKGSNEDGGAAPPCGSGAGGGVFDGAPLKGSKLAMACVGGAGLLAMVCVGGAGVPPNNPPDANGSF